MSVPPPAYRAAVLPPKPPQPPQPHKPQGPLAPPPAGTPGPGAPDHPIPREPTVPPSPLSAGASVVRRFDPTFEIAAVSGGARLLKAEGRRAVYLAECGTRRIVLKSRELSAFDRLRASLRLGALDREARGLQLLQEAGVPGALPLALLRDERAGRHIQCLAVEAVEGRTLLEAVADSALGARRRLALARAAGELVAATTRAGLFNRDPKPSNIICRAEEAPQLCFIDPDVRRGPQPVRTLASLVIEPSGCGVRLSRTMLLAGLLGYVRAMAPGLGRAAARESVREFWRLVSERVRRHGDPRPAVNPLGRAGRQ